VDAEARIADQLLERTVTNYRVMHRLVGKEAETAPAMPRDHRTSQRHVPGRRPKHHDRGSAGDDREMHGQPEEPARYGVEDVGRQMRAHLSRVALHRITFIAASGGLHGSSEGLVTL